MITYNIKKATTNVSVTIRIIDSTDGTPETGVVWNSAGIDMQYRREGAASVAITEATLALLTTAHTDGGFLHIGNGFYRLDLPDAACATGANGVLVHGTVTGMVVIGCYIHLVDYDPFDAVRLGLTALPNAAADAAGGLPISDAGGLDLDSKLANTNEITTARMAELDAANIPADIAAVKSDTAAILTDTGTAGVIVATNNDKTGYDLNADQSAVTVGALTGHTAQTGDNFARLGAPAGASVSADIAAVLAALPAAPTSGTADSGSTTTMVDAARTEADTDYWAGSWIRFTSGTISGQVRLITGFAPATDTFTFAPAVTQAVTTNTYEILPAAHVERVLSLTANDDKTGYDLNADQSAVTVGTVTTNTDMRGTDNAALASVATEARLAELDAANLPTDVANVKTDTGAILTDTGTTLETHLTDIKGATFSGATDSLEAIRDRGDAAWTTGAGGSDRLLMVDTTIATLASQTSFTLTAGSTDDDAYNNCTIVIEDASTSTQKAVGIVSDYAGSTKTVTLKYDPAVFVMAATDKVYILAENALKASAANRQLDVTTGGAAGIDWGNVENPTTAVDLSGTDIQLCDTVTTLTGHTAQTGDNFARLGAPAGASVSADIAAIPTSNPSAVAIADQVWDEAKAGHVGVGSFGEEVQAHALTTEVAAVETDTQDIQTRLPAALVGGRMDSDVGAKTGNVALSTQEKADVNAEVVDALATDTYAEPASVPAATSSLKDKINWLFTLARNKITQTATTQTLRNDADSADIATSTISDDNTTFTRGEFT